MKAVINKKIGALKCQVIEGLSANGPCVVFFHGYGADSSDLIPLAEMMALSPKITWVFPEAPLQVIIAPGFFGRAWFQIDNKRLEIAMKTGQPADMSMSTPKGLDSAREVAISMYEELLERHSSVVLGGFSQGAMLATEISLVHKIKPNGVVLMSGTLLCKDRWRELATTCAGLPFIQTHGKNDALLGFEYAEALFQMLTSAGLTGEFFSFNGGHEIPPKVIERIASFLRRTIK